MKFGLEPVEWLPPAFTRDGRSVLVRIRAVGPGSGREKLGLVPLDGGEPALVEPTGGSLRGVLKADPRTLWQPRPDTVTALLRDEETGENLLVRIDLETGRQTTLVRDRRRLRFLGAGGDHRAAVGSIEGRDIPQDLHGFDQDLAPRARLSRIEPRYDAVGVGAVESFTTDVPLHDGTIGRAGATILPPPGARRGDRLPTLVVVYAGSDLSRAGDEFGGGDAGTSPLRCSPRGATPCCGWTRRSGRWGRPATRPAR